MPKGPTWTPKDDAAVRAMTEDELIELNAGRSTKELCTIPGLNNRTKGAVRFRLYNLSKQAGGEQLKLLLRMSAG